MPVHDSHRHTDRYLKLIRTPLTGLHHQRQPSESRYEPASSSETEAQKQQGVPSDQLHDTPAFHRHQTSTNSELFYDLFFVANLTVFTYVHEVNDHVSLAQYIGFFAVLWFTWFQVGLYDVRFSMDSILARVAKLCHFAVMLGFAAVSVNFSVGDAVDEYSDHDLLSNSSLKVLTLFLMGDRLVLFCQYLSTIGMCRGYRRAVVPLCWISGIYFVAAMVYLGLYWTFDNSPGQTNYTYLVWYVVAVLETLVVTLISMVWRVISFKGTHLVERMSLLTLIIFGEGVIGLAKRLQEIAESTTLHFYPSIWAYFFCALMILYLLYMLYFDWIAEEHFGTIRQQIWAGFHFPFHLALVLAVEGIGQCIAWRQATIKSFEVLALAYEYHLDGLAGPRPSQPASFFRDTAIKLNETAAAVFQDGAVTGKDWQAVVTNGIRLSALFNATDVIAAGDPEVEGSVDRAYLAIAWIVENMQLAFLEISGFAPPHTNSSDIVEDAQGIDFNNIELTTEKVDEYQGKFTDTINVFRLTFIYFFICIGLVVIFNTILGALTHKHRWTVGTASRLLLSGMMGLGLALLATIAVNVGVYDPQQTQHSAFYYFVTSAWVLPTIVLVLFAVIVVNNVRLPKENKGLRFLPRRLSRD